MRMYDIIEKKRNGGELSDSEISEFIKGYTNGSIPDYQASALLMAIYFKGMTAHETSALTLSMAASGDNADLSELGNYTADKHSTGGVGDKTTMIVAPIAAALGLTVAKMSGRGLGHTGGTVDKLEAIPGYKTALQTDEFIAQAKRIGIAVVGQTGNFAPADKKLYALRDVTATVESIPLIASSIMSKKLASGAKTLVLDVKYGSGAFMKNSQDAEKLAKAMVEIGKLSGRNVAAVISNMDIPLGNKIGNSLEIAEAVEVLSGNTGGDLKGLCLTLAAQMYSSATGEKYETAYSKAEAVLDSGAAIAKFKEWITAQSGDISFVDNLKDYTSAEEYSELKAPVGGYISHIATDSVGIASAMLGAGREKLGDSIDFSAGITLLKKTGDYVESGETLAILQSRAHGFDEAKEKLSKAYEFSSSKPAKAPLIYKIITE